MADKYNVTLVAGDKGTFLAKSLELIPNSSFFKDIFQNMKTSLNTSAVNDKYVIEMPNYIRSDECAIILRSITGGHFAANDLRTSNVQRLFQVAWLWEVNYLVDACVTYAKAFNVPLHPTKIIPIQRLNTTPVPTGSTDSTTIIPVQNQNITGSVPTKSRDSTIITPIQRQDTIASVPVGFQHSTRKVPLYNQNTTVSAPVTSTGPKTIISSESQNTTVYVPVTSVDTSFVNRYRADLAQSINVSNKALNVNQTNNVPTNSLTTNNFVAKVVFYNPTLLSLWQTAILKNNCKAIVIDLDTRHGSVAILEEVDLREEDSLWANHKSSSTIRFVSDSLKKRPNLHKKSTNGVLVFKLIVAGQTNVAYGHVRFSETHYEIRLDESRWFNSQH